MYTVISYIHVEYRLLFFSQNNETPHLSNRRYLKILSTDCNFDLAQTVTMLVFANITAQAIQVILLAYLPTIPKDNFHMFVQKQQLKNLM